MGVDKGVQSQSVTADLAIVANMTIAELRARWRITFRSDPPKAFGPDLLRRSLAQQIQKAAFGGLSPTAQKFLNQLVSQAGKNGGKIVLPRRIKPGAILVREWKDTTHRVTVLADGFSWQGKAYPSLSEIARLITGSRWNGPRFFGLRKAEGSQ